MRFNFICSLVIALCITLFSHSHIAQAQSPNPQPAFEAALDVLNQRTTVGERYRIAEMQTAGAWSYAIATPAVSSGVDDHASHNFAPMIGVLEGERWKVLIGSPATAAEFNALLTALPPALMDASTKDFIAQPISQPGVGPLVASNMSGHRLPWRKGAQGFVAQRDGSGHANQVDFDVQGLAATGDVVASKAGTVVFVKESSSSGSCDGANFSNVWKQTNVVVVRHSAGEYSWYVHLAPNSVPVQVGDTVSAGAKIGVEGATGFACGVHIHYMASNAIPASWTDPANPNVAPWPPAGSVIPVDFDEAPWLALVPGTWITSQNDGITPCAAPVMQTPADSATITATVIQAAWNAVSGCLFNGYVARIKDVIDPNAGGTTITETTSSALTTTFTLDAAWANREVFVHVRANAAGAAWASRRVNWQPAPTGSYTFYEGAHLDGASFSSNQTFTELLSVNFDGKARSMQVDAGVGVVLCSEPNLRGDCARALGPAIVDDLDTLMNGLAGGISSVRACFGACPAAPITPALTSPLSPAVAFSGTVVLMWKSAGDAYEIEVSGGAMTTTQLLPWAGGTERSLVLKASASPYQWRVRAANAYGSGPWNAGSFKVIDVFGRVYLPATVRK